MDIWFISSFKVFKFLNNLKLLDIFNNLLSLKSIFIKFDKLKKIVLWILIIFIAFASKVVIEGRLL